MNSVERAVQQLRKGGMVAIYDSGKREGEVDLAFHASFVTPKKIMQLRKDAGGLICVAIDWPIAKKLALPFLADVVCSKNSPLKGMKCKKTAYGDKPAFSLSINHKSVYTGITDNDRVLTIKKFCEMVENNCSKKEFIKNFYTPGHVFLLIGRGIEKRKGHTELSLELARRAGLSPVMVLCEMLDYGKALSKKKAIEYAKMNKIEFVEGEEIWRKIKM
jgi:3,4-dihydroxy 2-butanone 4-phosphate synthase